MALAVSLDQIQFSRNSRILLQADITISSFGVNYTNTIRILKKAVLKLRIDKVLPKTQIAIWPYGGPLLKPASRCWKLSIKSSSWCHRSRRLFPQSLNSVDLMHSLHEYFIFCFRIISPRCFSHSEISFAIVGVKCGNCGKNQCLTWHW